MKGLLVLLIIILLCSLAESTDIAKAPYEATWVKLEKSGDVIHNFPNLCNDGETKSPYIIKIDKNQLTWINFADCEPLISQFEIEKRDNDIYFLFLIPEREKKNFFSFQLVDRKKYIARWNIYYSHNEPQMSSDLYIDSLYNTFPIVDYEWGPLGEIDGAWD